MVEMGLKFLANSKRVYVSLSSTKVVASMNKERVPKCVPLKKLDSSCRVPRMSGWGLKTSQPRTSSLEVVQLGFL